jgi:hypothetical protein
MKDSTKKEIDHEAYMRQDENGDMSTSQVVLRRHTSTFCIADNRSIQ